MVKQILENELKALEPKLQKTRENNDLGTYKNLIVAYKEILNLLLSVSDRNYEISVDNIVGSNSSGQFILESKNKIVSMDYINEYFQENNSLALISHVVDKNIFLDFKKNQFKGYVLTHIIPVRNCNQEDSIMTKKYKILASNWQIKSFANKNVEYVLYLKLKSIK